MTAGHWFLWTLIVFLTLIHIKGQSEPIQASTQSRTDSQTATSDFIGESRRSFSEGSVDSGGGGNSYPDPRRKRYQPASLLVRPLWMDPRKTWKAFQLNSSRSEKKEEENRKIRDKKRNKTRKLMEKFKKAAILSKKLFLILNEINNSLNSDQI